MSRIRGVRLGLLQCATVVFGEMVDVFLPVGRHVVKAMDEVRAPVGVALAASYSEAESAELL